MTERMMARLAARPQGALLHASKRWLVLVVIALLSSCTLTPERTLPLEANETE